MRNGVGQCRTTGLRTFGACGDRSTASALRAGMEYFLPHLKVFNSPLLPDLNICSNLRQSFET